MCGPPALARTTFFFQPHCHRESASCHHQPHGTPVFPSSSPCSRQWPDDSQMKKDHTSHSSKLSGLLTALSSLHTPCLVCKACLRVLSSLAQLLNTFQMDLFSLSSVTGIRSFLPQGLCICPLCCLEHSHLFAWLTPTPRPQPEGREVSSLP